MGHQKEENARVQRWAGATVTLATPVMPKKKPKKCALGRRRAIPAFWPEFDVELADFQPSCSEAPSSATTVISICGMCRKQLSCPICRRYASHSKKANYDHRTGHTGSCDGIWGRNNTDQRRSWITVPGLVRPCSNRPKLLT